jgi:hypothetical protein
VLLEALLGCAATLGGMLVLAAVLALLFPEL